MKIKWIFGESLMNLWHNLMKFSCPFPRHYHLSTSTPNPYNGQLNQDIKTTFLHTQNPILNVHLDADNLLFIGDLFIPGCCTPAFRGVFRTVVNRKERCSIRIVRWSRYSHRPSLFARPFNPPPPLFYYFFHFSDWPRYLLWKGQFWGGVPDLQVNRGFGGKVLSNGNANNLV